MVNSSIISRGDDHVSSFVADIEFVSDSISRTLSADLFCVVLCYSNKISEYQRCSEITIINIL